MKNKTKNQLIEKKINAIINSVFFFSEELKTAIINKEIFVDDNTTPICDKGAQWLLEKRDEIENISQQLIDLLNTK